MSEALDWTCGIGWSIAYIVAIAVGLRHKTYCIPRLSICMNLSWEFWAVVSRLQSGSALSSGFISQLLWLFLDLGVLLTWLLHEKDYQLKKKLLMFVFVFLSVFLWAFFFNGWLSSVFIINLLMSVEFLLTVGNGNFRSSRTVAVFKLIGTAAATILNGYVIWNSAILWIGGCCLILDTCYLFCLLGGQKDVYDEKSEEQFDIAFEKDKVD